MIEISMTHPFDDDLEITFKGEITGRHIPASMSGPAEYPCVELREIWVETPDGKMVEVTVDEEDRFTEACGGEDEIIKMLEENA